MSENKLVELCGLWTKQGKSGEYFSGSLGSASVLVFRNQHKKPGETTPDWRVYVTSREKKVIERTAGPMILNQDPVMTEDDLPF